MNRIIRSAAFAAAGASLLALALPTQAAEPTVAPDKIVASNDSGGLAAKDEKLICKRFENTATRMNSKRVCYTSEQWKKFGELR